MLPPDAKSDRFLITKETKLVGHRSEKFVFRYVLDLREFSGQPSRKSEIPRTWLCCGLVETAVRHGA